MRLFLLSLLLIFAIISRSQSLETGILPQVTFTAPLGDKWEYTFKLESMQSFYSEGEQDYQYIRTDLQNFVSFRLTPFSKIAGGYQYRFLQSGENSHRYIQQYSWLQRLRQFRIGHRIRTDQTVSPAEKTEFRFRYRLSTDLPLNGSTIDPREFYLIVSDEVVLGLQSGLFDLENRIGLSLGNNLTNNRKVELGLDYRLDRPDQFRNRLWWTLAFFFKI
jgi:hypothetical protein